METYHVNGDNDVKKEEAKGEHKPEVKESDLFLSGGFDTFTPENEIPLGSGTPFIDDRKYNPYGRQQRTYRPAMGFWKKFFVAFVPVMYDRYSGMPQLESKQFVKSLAILYVVTSMLPALLFMMFGGKLLADVLQQPQLASFNLSFMTLVIFLVAGFIAVLLYQLFYRINAWFVRLFGGLVSYIEKVDVRDSDMYAISIFSLVPAPILGGIVSAFFTKATLEAVASGNISSMFGVSMVVSVITYLVIPLIYMAIAMPRMDK